MERQTTATNIDENSNIILTQQEEMEELSELADRLDIENVRLSQRLYIYRMKELLCCEIMGIENIRDLDRIIQQYTIATGKVFSHSGDNIDKWHFVTKNIAIFKKEGRE
jgi:hypothetical protein